MPGALKVMEVMPHLREREELTAALAAAAAKQAAALPAEPSRKSNA